MSQPPTRAASRLALGLAALIGASITPSVARAQAEPKTAEQLANEAYEQHAAGRYSEAIATYLRAYAVSRAGVVLFNIATIYDRKMHERELAMEYYRRYLRAPDAEPTQVQKASLRLTALKAEADAAAAAAPPPPTAVPTTEPPASASPTVTPAAETPPAAPSPGPAPATEPARSSGAPLRTAGVVVGAVGVAGVGASMVLGLVAKSKNDEANTMCNGSACTTDRGVTLAHDAGTFATASTVAFVAGLALVGAGVTMYLVAPRTPAATGSVTVAPQVTASGGGVALCGRF